MGVTKSKYLLSQSEVAWLVIGRGLICWKLSDFLFVCFFELCGTCTCVCSVALKNAPHLPAGQLLEEWHLPLLLNLFILISQYVYPIQIWPLASHNWTKYLDCNSGLIWCQNIHEKIAHIGLVVPVLNLHCSALLWFQLFRHGGKEHFKRPADRWCINYFQIKLCKGNIDWIVLHLKIWRIPKHLNHKCLGL